MFLSFSYYWRYFLLLWLHVGVGRKRSEVLQLNCHFPSNSYFRFHSWVPGILCLFLIQNRQVLLESMNQCYRLIWQATVMAPLFLSVPSKSTSISHKFVCFSILFLPSTALWTPFSSSLFSFFLIPSPNPSYSVFLQLLCQNPLHRLRFIYITSRSTLSFGVWPLTLNSYRSSQWTLSWRHKIPDPIHWSQCPSRTLIVIWSPSWSIPSLLYPLFK